MKLNAILKTSACLSAMMIALPLLIPASALANGSEIAAQVDGQGTTTSAEQQASENTAPLQLEQVVVTAEKRSESLQTIPFSITSLTSHDLLQKGITSFVDYGTQVPNLSFDSGASAEAFGVAAARSVSIRGVSGVDTTGFYIDDTPIPDSVDPRIVDISRIEVLRGPQGTLYGARSMGGTVRLITNDPDPSGISGDAHAGISDTRLGGVNYFGDAVVNAPLVPDKAAVRIVGMYDDESGYFRRSYPDPVNPAQSDISGREGGNKTFGGSISGLVKVTDRFTVTPRFMYQKTTSDGFPLADGILLPNGQFAPLTDASFTHAEVANSPESYSDRWYLANFDMKYAADFGTFTLSSAYFDRYTNEKEDLTNFLTIAIARTVPGFGSWQPPAGAAIEAQHSFTRVVEEGRFVSNFSGPFQFTGGIYYSSTRDKVVLPPAIQPGYDQIFGPGADFIINVVTSNNLEEYAGYGEASYNITKKLKATVGARYYTIKNSEPIDYLTGWIVGSTTNIPPVSDTESGVTPKFNLSYQITPDDMIYGTVSKGFRPGGFSIPVPSGAPGCAAELAAFGLTAADTGTYHSDSLWNYEGGIKTSWLNHRLTVNAAGFDMQWSNIQEQVLLGCGFQFVANAAAAESKGAELEVRVLPARGLTLELNMGYEDAHITKISPEVANFLHAGERVFQTPQWTVSGSTDYVVPITDKYNLAANATYSYVGSSSSANNNVFVPRKRPAYTIVDARLGLEWDNYTLTAFVKNITDTRANFADERSIAAETPGQPRVVTNQPRTFGIEGRVNF